MNALLHYGVKGMKWKDHDYVEPEVSEEDFNTLKDIMSGTYKGPMSPDEQSAFIQRVGYAKSATTGKTFMAMSNAEILDKLKNGGAMSKPVSALDPKAVADGKDKVDDTLKKKGSKKVKKTDEDGNEIDENGNKKEKGGSKKGGGGGGGDAKKAEKEVAVAKKKEEQAAATAKRKEEQAAATAKRQEEQEARKIELLKLKEEREAIRKEKEEIRALLENAKKEALEAKKQATLRDADIIVKKMSKYSNTGLKRG